MRYFHNSSKPKNILLIIIMLAGAFISIVITIGDSSRLQQQQQQQQQLQIVFAQGNSITNNNDNNTIDTFNAKGSISSLAAGTLFGSNTTLGSHSGDLFVLGGDWNLAVTNGNLSNFNTEIIMTKFDDSGRHTHYIGNLQNATGEVLPITNKTITLTNGGNFTNFMGTSDISTNGEIKWKDVPITVHLLNGNIINIMVNPIKTDYHFKALPIYGTITSITDKSGKELRNE